MALVRYGVKKKPELAADLPVQVKTHIEQTKKLDHVAKLQGVQYGKAVVTTDSKLRRN